MTSCWTRSIGDIPRSSQEIQPQYLISMLIISSDSRIFLHPFSRSFFGSNRSIPVHGIQKHIHRPCSRHLSTSSFWVDTMFFQSFDFATNTAPEVHHPTWAHQALTRVTDRFLPERIRSNLGSNSQVPLIFDMVSIGVWGKVYVVRSATRSSWEFGSFLFVGRDQTSRLPWHQREFDSRCVLGASPWVPPPWDWLWISCISLPWLSHRECR